LLTGSARGASCAAQQHALITCPLIRQKKSAGEPRSSGHAKATKANQARSCKACRERRIGRKVARGGAWQEVSSVGRTETSSLRRDEGPSDKIFVGVRALEQWRKRETRKTLTVTSRRR